MAVNFNDSTPAAPGGHTNVQWQKDSMGNVSANIVSPVAASGPANEVLATPDGSTGAVGLRALVAADIPSLAESKITGLVSDLAAKAPLASPALTGTPTAPTAAPGTNTTQLATTAFVTAATGATAVSFADNETPSGTVNGSNTAFVLAHTPSPAASLQFFVNGVLQVAGGTDYTLVTATATFGSAPTTGAVLTAFYRY